MSLGLLALSFREGGEDKIWPRKTTCQHWLLPSSWIWPHLQALRA